MKIIWLGARCCFSHTALLNALLFCCSEFSLHYMYILTCIECLLFYQWVLLLEWVLAIMKRCELGLLRGRVFSIFLFVSCCWSTYFNLTAPDSVLFSTYLSSSSNMYIYHFSYGIVYSIVYLVQYITPDFMKTYQHRNFFYLIYTHAFVQTVVTSSF